MRNKRKSGRASCELRLVKKEKKNRATSSPGDIKSLLVVTLGTSSKSAMIEIVRFTNKQIY